MAKLFLSYSRKNARDAERLTRWLERDGHDVWRDEDDIGGGTSFSAEIEKGLNDCDAVLVLWSADSVQSAWVRDEAGFGRDAGKLIPFSLDGTEPPLGFRQFQAIGLERWKRAGEPRDPDRIRAAIARITQCERTGTSPRTSGRPVRSGLPRWTWAAAAALAGLLIAAAAVFLWQRGPSEREIAIAVMASAQSSDRAMAADYANVAAADMAAVLPRHFDRAKVISPNDASAAASAYRMLVSTDPHGSGANATLTLSDLDGRTTLWSQNWSVPDAAAADLENEMSAAASKAAICLIQAKGGRTTITQPALSLYLSGCTGLGGTQLSNQDFVSMFERVTKLAPDFGPGWDYLALSRSWIASVLQARSAPGYQAALKSTRDTIAVARRLNPDSAMSYDAEFHLISGDTFRALQVLEQGAKVDPTDGRIQMHLSDQLLSVGRMADSVEAAKNGVELEPASSYNRYQYILALIYSGQFSRAKEDITQARKKWPGDYAIDLADFSFQFRYGDPRTALQLLPRVANASDADMTPDRKLIAARLDPTAANIDAAIAALHTLPAMDPAGHNDVLTALGNFGRVDQAYQLLQDPRFQPFVDRAILFRPDFAGVRADPRFMAVAARLGLVRYWRRSGYWPDFCSSEQLKYECKAEAAKYPG